MHKGVMGRPRNAGNKDLPQGLYRRKDGTYYTKHPVTGAQATFDGVTDRALALAVFENVRAGWRDAIQDARAERIALKLQGLSRPRGVPLLTEYARTYRLERLPKAVSLRKGRPLAQGTCEDYGRMLANQIEPAELLRIPINLPEPLPYLRKFLAQWLDSPEFYNYMKALLSRLYQSAVDEGLTLRNPTSDIARRAVPPRDVYVPHDHYAAITAKLADWEARACDLIYLVSHRPGDVLRLQDREPDVQYVNRNGRRILMLKFEPTKNEVAMEIYDESGALEDVLQWFRRWKAEQGLLTPHMVVFPRKKYAHKTRRRSIGKPITVGYLSRRLAWAVVEAGFDKGQYQLRDLRKKGLNDEAKIAGRATDKGGHKTEQMKQYYVVEKLPVRVTNNLRVIRGG